MLKEIRLVEIEIHSYCNRKCEWCPNSIIDRTFYKELPENLFIKVLSELSDIEYNKYISLSRYEEPFSYPKLLKKRLSQIRYYLPKARIVMATNGDYDYTGFDIDELTVMDYEEKLNETMEDSFRIMRLNNINDRGGYLNLKDPQYRTIPCSEPKYFIGIDYNGYVVPCCNIRSDIMNHRKFIIGNIKENTLEEIIKSDKAIRFRHDTSNMIFPAPCKYCSKMGGRYTSDNPSIRNKQT